MTDNLYCALKKFSLRYAYFLYFDVEPYLADRLFIRHEVPVWFDQEYKREGSPYLGIVCHVKKKDVPRFRAAQEDLKNSMLLCGYPGYPEDIAQLLADMERMRGAAQ